MAATSRSPIAPRVFLAGMLGGLAAAALVIVAMVLLGEYTKTRGRLLLTALVLAGFCLSALPSSVLHRRRRYLPAGESGMLAAAAGFLLVTTGIWATPNPDAYWKAAAIASIIAASTFHTSLLLLVEPIGSLVRRLLWVPIGATLLAALLSALGIIFEVRNGGYWWAVFFIIVAALASGFGDAVLSRGKQSGKSRQTHCGEGTVGDV